MSEKTFIGSMILIVLAIFLVISMIMQSCQVDYTLTEYVDDDGESQFICCYNNATGYDPYHDECIGAPKNATEGASQKDLLENIKIISPHIYMIIIIVMMGLAVLGVILMV